ncbi:MAG: RHS repeat-associated core domain-containing protein [Planctomycetota bacterium]
MYFYDANGNVGQLVSTGGALLARYEYDPYGNVQSSSGSLADANPFRFSTKYFDAEIDYADTTADGLYYYGYRYYSPRLGRWLNRDPIGEKGGQNLYAFVRNTAIDAVDPVGKDTIWWPDWEPKNPSVDKSEACCEYMITDATKMDERSFCQKTEKCPPGASRPMDCCRCVRGATALKPRDLIKASWGECCWCNIYRARVAGTSWPKHQSLFIVCPTWSKKIDFVYKRVSPTWGYTTGQEILIYPGSTNPENDPSMWSVQHVAKVSCRMADTVLWQAEKDQLNTPDYNIIHDCHWYAAKLFDMGVRGGEECRF